MKRASCPTCGRRVFAAALPNTTRLLLLEVQPDPEGSVVLLGMQSESGVAVGGQYAKFLSAGERQAMRFKRPEERPTRWALHRAVCPKQRRKSA